MYKCNLIRKNLIFIEADTQYEICSMFMRPQEFYESPFPDIKGRFFSVEHYMDTYVESKGRFSYFEDWIGFNIPSNVLEEFYQKFYFDLTRKEAFLFGMIKNLGFKEKYYVIGACKEKDIKRTISHECAHAYYYLDLEYQIRVNELIGGFKHTEIFRKELLKRGYDEEHLDDEIQAYLATTDKKVLIKTFKNLPKDMKIPNSFRKIFQEKDIAFSI